MVPLAITVPTLSIFLLLAFASGALVAAGVGALWLAIRGNKKNKNPVTATENLTETAGH